MATRPAFVTQDECCTALRISVRTLRNWSSQRWFPRSAKKGRLWCPEKIKAAREKASETELSTETTSKAESGDRDWEGLRWNKETHRTRREAALAVLECAEAGKELRLLMPRIAIEATLSELMSSIASFLEEIGERTHQIEGLTSDQQKIVEGWLKTLFEPWQVATVRRIQRVLSDLGPVPELLDLAKMSGVPAASEEGEDG